jgi:hypothetical protein|tara:strand:- start:2107 stop:2397 length:291 start_codon:yes stop_codon:yes gene_type:complete
MSTHFIYGVATNTGKGFLTVNDRQKFFVRGYPADVWMIGNTVDGAMWLAEKSGVEKTKAEAQALIDAEVQAAQASWDAESDEYKAQNDRPGDIILP